MRKGFPLFISLTVIMILFSFVSAQDDEARQQSGLPTFIGSRPGAGTTPGADAALSGAVTVQGMVEGAKPPELAVSVYANGSFVARQRVQNRGGFSFSGVPKLGVTLVVEADGLEIASLPVGTLNPPPLPNRQDVVVTWMQISQKIERRNEVISLRDSYQRSPENQKLLEKIIKESVAQVGKLLRYSGPESQICNRKYVCL